MLRRAFALVLVLVGFTGNVRAQTPAGECFCLQVKLWDVDADTSAYWAFLYEWGVGDDECNDDTLASTIYYADRNASYPTQYCLNNDRTAGGCELLKRQKETHEPEPSFEPKAPEDPVDIPDSNEFVFNPKTLYVLFNDGTRDRYAKLFWGRGKVGGRREGVGDFGYGFEIRSLPKGVQPIRLTRSHWSNATVMYQADLVGGGQAVVRKRSPTVMLVTYQSRTYVVRIKG